MCHQYSYPQMVEQMKAAKLSMWNNKWTDIFDFTPAKGGKTMNHTIHDEINPNFVTNMKQMETIIKQLEKVKGCPV